MEWISVKERLPKDEIEKLVLVRHITTNQPAYKITNMNPALTGFYVQFDHEGVAPIEVVTHWMPLPEPPEHKDEN